MSNSSLLSTARPRYDANAVTTFVDGSSLLVVIVNYRSANLVIECLESLRAHRGASAAMRVVVVDNPSGDDSVDTLNAAIREHGWSAWVLLVPSERNGGYSFGNNLAIRPALAANRPPEFIWLLNPDTRVEPGAIDALVGFLQQHPKVGIAGSCLMDPDGSAWATAFRFPTVWSELEGGIRAGLVTKLLRRWVVAQKMGSVDARVDWLPGASMMIRREVFASIGLFDEDYFLYYEETDFCLQARRAGFECWYVAESRVTHIAGQSTGVTARGGALKRRPKYVFESRRRYFTKNHGIVYSALADILFIAGYGFWKLRRLAQRHPESGVPNLLRDTIRNSVFFRRGS